MVKLRIVSICVLFAAVAVLRAEEVGESGYRRVFVPADRPDVWPTRGEKYLPVDPQQFRDVIAHAGEKSAPNEPSPYAIEAELYARYDSNHLIDGQGCVVIAPPPDQTMFLDWPTAGATIRDPRWKGRETESVKLGAWGVSGTKQHRQGLFVERAGSLLFNFQTAASVQTDESAQFTVMSPRALRRRLYVDLKEQYELVAEGGRVELQSEPAQAEDDSRDRLLELPPLQPGYRRWLFTGGPGGSLSIRVKQPPRNTEVRNEAPAYREQLTYSITPRGTELIAEFQFLKGRKLPRELTIEFDPELKPVRVQWNGVEIAWQPQMTGETGPLRIRIPVPEEARDDQPRLRLEAWSRLPPAEMSPLPQPSLPDLFWSEGELRIELADELALLDLRSGDLSPIQSKSSETTPTQRLWHFAKLRSQATAEIAVGEAENRVEASIGTSLELSSASTKAVIRMQLRATGRSLPPRLESTVNGDWVIDSVESSSVSGLTDWYVDPIGEKRVLRVQLREPLQAEYPGEVVIEAHLPKSAAAESLPLAELIPVDWRSLAPRRHILAITVIEPLDLQMTGDVKKLSFDNLTERDWELLQNSDVAALMLMDETNLQARLQLLPERPMFEADVAIAVEVKQDAADQSATIQLKAQRNPLRKIRVLLSPVPTEETVWIDPLTGTPLPAARISTPEIDSRGGEVWEVQLARGASGLQSLQARWKSDLRDECAVPLVALPDAAKQTATVTIADLHPFGLEYISTGLVQHPLVPAVVGEASAADAVYHYDPVQMTQDLASRRLTIRPRAAGEALPQTVVEQIELASQYSLQQESMHQSKFVLRGSEPVSCRLPDGARLQNVTWDGLAVKHSLQANELRLEPTAARSESPHVLQVQFTLPPQLLVDGASLQPPLPDLGLSIPAGRWTVQLPASVQLATGDYLRTIEPGWHGRLFGTWAQKSVEVGSGSSKEKANAPIGWRTWEIPFAGSLPPALELVDFGQRRALAYGVGLVVACFTAWQLFRRPHLLTMLLAVAAIAALWLPSTISIFATASWLGMWLGIGWSVVAARIGRTQTAIRIGELTPRLSYSTATLLACVALFGPQLLSAQDLPPAEPIDNAAKQTVVEVLIPVDAQGAPSGEHYFVPADFWEEALRASQQSGAEQGGDWVMLRGRYQGELHYDAAGGEVLPSLWSLSWDIEVQRRNVRVHIPIARSHGKWQTEASVDGIPIPVVWAEDGLSCEIEIREPGLHRVTMRVEPVVETDGPHAKLHLDLPPLPDAELRLTYPLGLKDLQLPDAPVPTALDQLRSKVVVAMSNSDRLELNWRSNGPSSASAAAWQVEQLELLSITPDGAELEVRLSMQGRGTPPAKISAVVDGALVPLDLAPLVVQEEASGDGRLVLSTIAVEQPASAELDRATATLRFRLPRNQVLGNYRFPQVEVLDLVTRSKVAAVSLSDRYTYEAIQNPVGETMASDEFAALWGGSTSSFSASYRILGEASPWTLSVQPRANSTPPEESLLVACGPAELDVYYQVQFAPGGFPVAKQTLQVPLELKVERLELERSTGIESLPWTQPAPGRLVAFLPEPLEGDFRLTLVGTVPTRPSQSNPIPIVTARPGENLSQRVQIYRRPEWLVDVDGPPQNSSLSEFAASHPWGTEAQLVESFLERPDRTMQRSIQVRSNPAEFNAQSLTWFDPEVGIAFTSTIEVTKGIVDRVSLEAPADWIGPLDITPPAQLLERGSITEGRRLVQIRFSNPVPAGESFVLRFSGAIAASKDGTRAMPILRLNDAKKNVSYLAIPENVSPAAKGWQLLGVEKAELPAKLAAESRLPPQARILQALPAHDQDYLIRHLPSRQDDPFAALALADVFVREDDRGSQLYTTQFLIPPTTHRELTIEWPSGHEALAVYLEDRLLTRLPVDSQRWRLPIGPTELPIVLTAVSRFQAAEGSQEQTIERPRLSDPEGPYPLALTLWTLESLGTELPPFFATAKSSTIADGVMLRLARLNQLVTSAEPRLAELPPGDRQAWKQLWSARLRRESTQLEQAKSLPAAGSRELIIGSDDLPPYEQLIAQVAQLLDRLEEPEEVAEAPSSPAVTSFSSRNDSVNPARQLHYVVSGPELSLGLRREFAASESIVPRGALTLIVIAAAAALIRWGSKNDLLQTLANHPRWLVAIGGIVWCVLLTPTAIGVALLAVAVISWAVDRWQRLRVSAVKQ